MLHLALALLGDTEIVHEPVAMWLFLSIGAIALFGIFLPVTTWLESRRKEREAYYKSETIRRIAEASGEGAKSALALLHAEEHLREVKRREGLKIGGLVNIGVGIGLTAMLWSLTGPGGPYLVGLIPGLVGVALLIYVFFMAEPV
jgi:Flp pilus assembly protein TadB